jgi:hypothetical protein
MGYTSFVSKLAALGIAGISVDICGVESNGTEDVYTSATTIALPFNAGYFLADKVPVGTYRVKVGQSSLPASFLRFTTSVDQLVTVAGNECASTCFGILPLPTYIALMAFNATPAPEGVSVTWSTGVEEDHLGFQLYRSPAISGARVPVGSFFHSLQRDRERATVCWMPEPSPGATSTGWKMWVSGRSVRFTGLPGSSLFPQR